LQAEVDDVMGDHTTVPDFAMLGRFRLLDAVANETLRLKPVAPIYYMAANIETEMDGYAIPAGTTIILESRVEALKDNEGQSDPEFRPDRWLSDESGAHFREVSQPFGAGPRMCPGRTLGLVEIKCAISMIARNFDLEVAREGNVVEEEYGFTLTPKTVGIKIRKRSRVLVSGAAGSEGGANCANDTR
jgi:cytochrome P450